MKKMYKDIRSMKSWLSRKLESDASNRVLQFHTLDSLTPDKISDIIRENFIDETDDKIPKWLRDQMDRNPRPIKKEDSDDQRLISLILFVVDHILSARIHNRKAFNKESGAVKVSTSALRQIVNDGSYIKHVMDVAQATSILSMVSQYVHKEDGEGEARTYRIHLGHITKEGNALAIVPCPDTKIAQKILAYKRRNQIRNERLPRVGSNKVLLSSLYQLSHLRADYDEALVVLKRNLADDIRRMQLIRKVKQEDDSVDTLDVINLRYQNALVSLNKVCSENIFDKHIKFDKTGRIHSNLTNFPSEIRQFLSFDECSEPLAMIDMANSQPFLLINLIMEFLSVKRGRKIRTRKQLEKYCYRMGYNDVMKYVAIVEDGSFYNECYRLYKGRKRLKEITPAQKERVREMIFTMVFFGDGSANWSAARSLAQAFANEYPTIMKVINHYREGNYTNLSDRLQQEESRLFIDKILARLLVKEKHPYILSLHDGFIAPVSEVPRIIDEFRKEYAKSGFQVKLKVDNLSTGKRRVETINARQ